MRARIRRLRKDGSENRIEFDFPACTMTNAAEWAGEIVGGLC